MRKFTIPKEYKGYTVAQYLKDVEGYSGRSIRNLVLILDKKKVKPTKKLRQFSRLTVYESEKGTNIEPIEMDLKIVYEDNDLLIIDKEPFLVTHPTLKKVDKTLAHGVVHHFEKNTGKRSVPRFYNRLDMNTSGLIVVTKNAFSQAYLQEKVDTKKYYMAIVKGDNPRGRVLYRVSYRKSWRELEKRSFGGRRRRAGSQDSCPCIEKRY